MKAAICLALVCALLVALRARVLADERPRSQPRPPSLLEISNLFQRVCRPAPDRVHFRASLRVISTPWTETAIQEAFESQQRLMQAHDRGMTSEERDMLRQVRLQSIRNTASGTNRYEVELWLSGELYRKDEVWVSIPAPSKWNYVVLGEPLFARALSFDSDHTFSPVELGGRQRAQLTGFVVNETLQSVSLYTNSPPGVEVDPLWDGHGLEPPFYVPVILALARTNELARSMPSPRLRSIQELSLVLDAQRASTLALGTHPTYSVLVSDAMEEGRSALCYSIESKGGNEDEKGRYTYVLDKLDRQWLYRVEFREPTQPTLTSVRSGYSSSGWPKLWRSDSLDRQGRVKTKEVLYTFLGDGAFDDWEVFAPSFPQDYAISVSSGNGPSQLVHNPRNLSIAQEFLAGNATFGIAETLGVGLCVVLVVIPLLLLRRWSMRASHSIETGERP